MRYKKRKGLKYSISPAKEKKRLMTKIAVMLDDGRLEESLPLLDKAVKKYPNEERFWEMYAFVGTELKIVTVMQKAFAKMTYFQPNDPDYWQNLALIHAIEGYPALASRIFREFAGRFPFDRRKTAALEMADFADEQIAGLLEAYNIPNDQEGMKIAVQHDRVQLYMHQGEYEKSIQSAKELIKKAPDFIATYNNLSLVYFMKGDVEKAVETAGIALEKQPGNFHALGNSARFLSFLGKNEAARHYADRLREQTDERFPDIYAKKIETYAYLGDDASVTEIYRAVEKKGVELGDGDFMDHLAAFSFYRLGDEQKARKLWKAAALEESEKNLSELALPVYERDVFAFRLNYLFPKVYIDRLQEITHTIGDDEDFDENLKKKMNEVIDSYPYLIDNFQTILERSDKFAKEFVINLTKWSENPKALEILKRFALSDIGSDSIRSRAAMILSEMKILPKKVQLWIRGEQTEIMLRSFFITGEIAENENYPMKAEVAELSRKGVEAMRETRLESAEQNFRQALEIQSDHPVLLNNLLAVRQMRGEKIDQDKEIKDLYARFPDYLFAAMSVGMLEVRDGNIEQAEAILEKFDDKEAWHISEFKMYSRLQIEISLEKEQFEGARNWLNQMKHFNSDFDLTPDEEEEFAKLEGRIELAELVGRMPTALSKLMNFRKKKKSKKK